MIDSDDGLVAAAREGDVEAFGLIYERHKNAVFSFVLNSVGRREDAEDIVQEVFCRAWRSIGRFRGESKLTTWLMSIAVNTCVEYARRDQRRRRLGVEVELSPDDAQSGLDMAGESIRRNAAREALGMLPESHRALVILCDVQGFSCEEAAMAVGCSTISARVRLCRARKRLRAFLGPILSEGRLR